jgi:mannose-6-phosphate isomerase
VPIRRIAPSFRERVWGVTTLEPWFPNPQERIGEVWFEPAPEIAAEFPLLVKFVFTSGKLSVQVHPDDAYARARHNCLGKTEMWHVLAAEAGAKIAAGFREPVTPERLKASALSGEIENLLEWHEAKAGDTFFIPAGTVHAIGPGLTLCEIQQNSDITYRLYDYGRPRELHLEDAVKVSRGDRCAPRAVPTGNSLVSCDYFKVDRLRITSLQQHHPPSGRSQMLIVVEGSGEIDGDAAKAGEAWMIDDNVKLSGTMTILTAAV